MAHICIYPQSDMYILFSWQLQWSHYRWLHAECLLFYWTNKTMTGSEHNYWQMALSEIFPWLGQSVNVCVPMHTYSSQICEYFVCILQPSYLIVTASLIFSFNNVILDISQFAKTQMPLSATHVQNLCFSLCFLLSLFPMSTLTVPIYIFDR